MAPMAARGAMQMLGLAAITYIGIIVQYKVWRHMKDNKILKYELERYEKKYNEAQQRMAREKARQAQGEEAMYQYAKDLEQEQLNEQGGKFTNPAGRRGTLATTMSSSWTDSDNKDDAFWPESCGASIAGLKGPGNSSDC
eukprot:CAMPEP_0195131894 /NCGR_PEP_ID=MMETSP0448-20130528/145930_1 /TAXON_ID=66468 /ORGANISM="Heterocapsa triquestra, Strain CCMP 448" /LENGTH=139 /DNA_ID=CAMNT_0040169875 /DNA_START=1 /DNA_END=421 /DNA_ORIENTATION=+